MLEHDSNHTVDIWKIKLADEFNSFYKELNKKFSNEKELTSLSSTYRQLEDNLNKLDEKNLDEIKKNLKDFENTLLSINEDIGKFLFTTRAEKFLLRIQDILFKIINHITKKDSDIIITESRAIPKKPNDYSAPLRILPERYKNSLFFSEKILSELNRIEPLVKKVPRSP